MPVTQRPFRHLRHAHDKRWPVTIIWTFKSLWNIWNLMMMTTSPVVFLWLSCKQKVVPLSSAVLIPGTVLWNFSFHKKMPALPSALLSAKADGSTFQVNRHCRDPTYLQEQCQPIAIQTWDALDTWEGWSPWRIAWRVSRGPISVSYLVSKKWSATEWNGIGNHQRMF